MNSITDSERQLNPFPWYQAMHSESPLRFWEQGDSWEVFSYDGVQRVLSDYSCFSSNFNDGDGPADSPIDASMISLDPPKHKQLRALVSQAFTPRMIERLAPRITAIADEYMRRLRDQSRMDVVHDFAEPLPVIVIAELLGIPVQDRIQFKIWSDMIVSTITESSNGDMNSFMAAQQEMSAYFLDIVEQRRREPKEDLISLLLAAQVEGTQLSMLELLGFCVLLLVAGNETTTNLITNAVLTFTEHPGTWETLLATPDLLPSAIEEVLRYRSPVQSMSRLTVKDTELHGKRILAGQPITAYIGAANHDPAKFAYPKRFDLHRTPNPHIAFGHGIHFCLGAPLARLEARIALRAMLNQFPHLTRDTSAPLRPLNSWILYGVQELLVNFTV